MPRLALLCFAFTACQPQNWQGAWEGTATINDGRQPLIARGTLDISNGAGIPAALMFAFHGTADGSSQLSCPPVLSTARSTSSTATLATPSTCQLTVSPADGCTWEALFNAGEFTLSANKLSGTGNGRLTKSCTGAGSGAWDFGFELSATQLER